MPGQETKKDAHKAAAPLKDAPAKEQADAKDAPAKKPPRGGLELEGDDEFEDFPAEDKEYIDAAEAAAAAKSKSQRAAAGDKDAETPDADALAAVAIQDKDVHQWEDTWEDDDETEDFAAVLKRETTARRALGGAAGMETD